MECNDTMNNVNYYIGLLIFWFQSCHSKMAKGKDKDKPMTSGLSSRKRLTAQQKGVAKSPASKRRIKIEAALARAAKLENLKEASVKTARKNPDSGDKENQGPRDDPTGPVEIQELPFDLEDYQETVRSKIAKATSQDNGDGSVLGKFMNESYDCKTQLG